MYIVHELRRYYDNFGTGNYTEDILSRHSSVITADRAREFISFLQATGATFYESKKAYYYEVIIDSTHYKLHIFYKG